MTKKISLLIQTVLLIIISFSNGWAQTEPNKTGFEQYLDSLFPLKPEYIAKVRQRVASQESEAEVKPGEGNNVGKPQIFQVSTNPASRFTHPVINIGLDMITSIVITDQKGKIWPIKQFTIGNSKDFKITWPNKQGGVLLLQGLKAFQETNVAIMLKGLDVPVMVTFLTGQKTWSDMNYLRVSTRTNSNKDDTTNINQTPLYLVNLLAGIAPEKAMLLAVKGVSDGTKVWAYHHSYLVLTPDLLISPQWHFQSENDGVDEMHVYEIKPTSHLLLNNKDRGVFSVTVEEG
ncbi:DotH/IcmK family type IV secretion protein [Facilibium subflavum]|uniref:DotH/IcmK family type IV secretion protein n=1 Tax=Facilibium subflavum TaxID=2219058 RepID=UPI0013C2F8C1|nr:DotH/IcmK family type IV secretion protein [Facilibium subflavum]